MSSFKIGDEFNDGPNYQKISYDMVSTTQCNTCILDFHVVDRVVGFLTCNRLVSCEMYYCVCIMYYHNPIVLTSGEIP